MKRFQFLILIACASFMLPGCSTYHIAEATAPTNLYANSNAADVDSTISAGSVLLLRGKPKNGMIQARYHTGPTWYWTSNSNFSPIPMLMRSATTSFMPV